ncbi:hypothetical protein GQ457_01G010870 [Hibiscus cannabinus]
MGFGVAWCAWILEYVSTAKVSILINGSPSKEFKMLKGLRQGDPISHFLFIAVTEAMHLLFKKAEEGMLIEGIKYLVPHESISHLQFADDTILFLRPCEEYIINTTRILRCFEVCSGLSINFKKSYLVGINVEAENLKVLAGCCGCKIGALPFNYLGIPLGVDPRRVSTWDPVIERFRMKLSGWKCRSLSFAGRVVLINSVLSVLPLYYLSIFVVPKLVLLRIDKIIRRNFLWGNWTGNKKLSRPCWITNCSKSRKASRIWKGIVSNLFDEEEIQWLQQQQMATSVTLIGCICFQDLCLVENWSCCLSLKNCC